MPGVPEQPKPREENKREEKEVDSATQTDDGDNRKGKADDDNLSDERVEQLKKDPKVVVHCELQDELDKEFEERGLHFDSPSKRGEEGNDNNQEDDNKQKAGDDTASKPAA